MTPTPPHKTPDPGWMGDATRGAGMGRPAKHPEPLTPFQQAQAKLQRAIEQNKFTLQRVRLDSQGYDSGGAYWGGGTPLYWYASEDGKVSDYASAARGPASLFTAP